MIPIFAQAFQAISRWDGKIHQFPNPIDLIQLATRDTPHRSWALLPGSARIRTVEDVLSAAILEGLYHGPHYNGVRYSSQPDMT